MKRLISCSVLFAAALGAQSTDWFQVQGPQFYQAFQSSPNTQVYEFRNGTLVGGTYLGVSLAEIDSKRGA